MKYLLTIIFFLFIILCYGQTIRQKLVVAEFRIDTPRAGNFTYLVSYNFENGSLISKDTIFGAETFRKDSSGRFTRNVRFEFGTNFIYKKRYVISGSGNVIDIYKKALVIEDGDDFIEASGDTLIFHRANIFTGTGFLMLNLITGKYSFINNDKLNKDIQTRSSPDKKHYLSIDQSVIPYKICLRDLKGTKEIVVFDAGHGPNISSGSQTPSIETYWQNNHIFLYAIHKICCLDSSGFNRKDKFYSKFYSTVTLRQFDINSKSDKQFFVLDSVKQGDINGRFIIDGIGQTLYRTSGSEYFLIDTVKQLLVDYPFYELGKGFSTKNNYDPEGNILKFHDTEIGRIRPAKKIMGNGIIAVEKNDNTIIVWSEITKAWIRIEIPWINDLIGWIDEE